MRISDWSSDVCSSDLITIASPTRAVAEFAVGLRYEDLPADIILNAKQCILDILGFSVFGANKPLTQSVARVVADRKSVVSGKSVSVRVTLGCRGIIKNKQNKTNITLTRQLRHI